MHLADRPCFAKGSTSTSSTIAGSKNTTMVFRNALTSSGTWAESRIRTVVPLDQNGALGRIHAVQLVQHQAGRNYIGPNLRQHAAAHPQLRLVGRVGRDDHK